jgi:hypothetical protein
LRSLARDGVQPHVNEDFEPNRGMTDDQRLQYKKLKRQTHHELCKQQDKGRCVILPKTELEGIKGERV